MSNESTMQPFVAGEEYSITMGSTDDDSSSWLSVNYYKQNRVNASTRSLAQFPVPNTANRHGSSGRLGVYWICHR